MMYDFQINPVEKSLRKLTEKTNNELYEALMKFVTENASEIKHSIRVIDKIHDIISYELDITTKELKKSVLYYDDIKRIYTKEVSIYKIRLDDVKIKGGNTRELISKSKLISEAIYKSDNNLDSSLYFDELHIPVYEASYTNNNFKEVILSTQDNISTLGDITIVYNYDNNNKLKRINYLKNNQFYKKLSVLDDNLLKTEEDNKITYSFIDRPSNIFKEDLSMIYEDGEIEYELTQYFKDGDFFRLNAYYLEIKVCGEYHFIQLPTTPIVSNDVILKFMKNDASVLNLE